MKKLWIITLSLLACFLFNIEAEAKYPSNYQERMNSSYKQVPNSEMALGGIGKFCTYNYLIQVYGKPDFADNLRYPAETRRSPNLTIRYGNGFELEACPINGQYYIFKIEVTENNGIATPAGIHVGSSVDDVRAAYGEPQHISPAGCCTWNLINYYRSHYANFEDVAASVKDNRHMEIWTGPEGKVKWIDLDFFLFKDSNLNEIIAASHHEQRAIHHFNN